MKTEIQTIVEKYCQDIAKNKIPHGIYVLKAINRFLSDVKQIPNDGYEYFIDWPYIQNFYDFTKLITLPDKDTNLQLLPWQLFIFANLLGFKYKDNPERRRFRQGAIYVPRKNGKTTGIMYPLLLWDFLTTPSAESYFFEKDERQAIKAFNELKFLIGKNEKLAKALNMTNFTISKNNSRIAYFASESVGIDFYKPSLAIIDEYWCFPDERCLTAMRYGNRARLNGLTLVITTAGTDISLPAYAEEEKIKKILNGVFSDETYFGIIFSADEKDNLNSAEAYIKANPSIGMIIDLKLLEQDRQSMLNTPTQKNDYYAKTLNIWTTGTSSWIPLNVWEDNQPEGSIDFSEFKDYTAYGAIDLSSINDFTVYTLCFGREGKYYFKHHFYLPEHTIQEKYGKININLPQWIEAGLITAIPGKVIDYDYVLKDILEDVEYFKIYSIYYDRWNSNSLIKQIDEEHPNILLVDFNQSLKNMSPATKLYEKNVYDKKIIDPNPIMRWMVGNTEIKKDINGNYKPLKEHKSSEKKIDGVVTSIMALQNCISNVDKPVTTNFDDILNLFR